MNKFIVGLVFGIAIAGGLAVYLNNAPTPFVNKTVVTSSASSSSGPIILAPGTKIQEATPDDTKNTPDAKTNASSSYDFYDVLQAKKASSAVVIQKSVKANPVASVPVAVAKYFIQAGAFGDEELAADMKGRLALLGIDSTIKSQPQGNSTVNRVLIGPLTTEENAQKIINQLSDQQINAVLIRITN